eukprot:m.165776 g.165776  ORF g.165776 m.165776 type:complete len:114 (-) comp9896_c0_seq1:71-412(-)
MYCCGDASVPDKPVGPLRLLRATDFADANGKRRVADFLLIMNAAAKCVRDAGKWSDAPTIQQANDAFATVEGALSIPTEMAKGRDRRVSQLGWRTVVNIVRHLKKGVPVASEA